MGEIITLVIRETTSNWSNQPQLWVEGKEWQVIVQQFSW